MNSEKIISILKDYAFGPAASSGEPFKLMLLYGSVAKDRFKAHSDVDIAVSADRPLSEDRLLETGAELSALLDRPVDVLDLFSTEGLILYKIMTGHIRIKIDAALYVKYYSKALGFREDFKPLQDMMREARIGRFIHGS